MGQKTSINIKPAKANSKNHNERIEKEKGELKYTRKDLQRNNQSWKEMENVDVDKAAREYCKKISGRQMRSDGVPVKEAVVVIQAHHTIEDLYDLGQEIEKRHGIHCFQIHIHRDEGRWVNDEGYPIKTKTPSIQPKGATQWIINEHAHLHFDVQDKKTGKISRFGKYDFSKLQDIAAEVLGMERGERKENSNTERLEATAYKLQQDLMHLERLRLELDNLEKNKEISKAKLQQEEKKIQTLQTQVNEMEQKKNQAAGANQAARARHDELANKVEANRSGFSVSEQRSALWAKEGLPADKSSLKGEHRAISRAIERQLEEIERIKSRIHKSNALIATLTADNRRREYLLIEARIEEKRREAQQTSTRIEVHRSDIESTQRRIKQLRTQIERFEKR
jgi:hypothetical protein